MVLSRRRLRSLDCLLTAIFVQNLNRNRCGFRVTSWGKRGFIEDEREAVKQRKSAATA